MIVNKHLDFQGLRNALADHVSGLKDTRQEGKVKRLRHDVCLSALAMMFFQDPSMPAFQTRLKNSTNKSNLQGLFGVKTIPQETQLKDIPDRIPSEEFYPVFKVFPEKLRKNNILKRFQFIDDAY